MHRSAFWLADGRWRQWEAYDCVNIGEYFKINVHYPGYAFAHQTLKYYLIGACKS